MSVREVREHEIGAFLDRGWALLPGLVEREVAVQLGQIGLQAFSQATTPSFNFPVDRAFRSIRCEDLPIDAGDIALDPVMGRNVARLLRASQIRLKGDVLMVKAPYNPGKAEGTIFHQDYPGHTFDRSSFLTVWIALADLPAESGTLQFVDRSHREGVLGDAFAQADEDLIVQNAFLGQAPLAGPFPMKAGDATVHHSLTVHGAPSNATRHPRVARAILYFDARARHRGGLYDTLNGAVLELGQKFDHPAFPLVPLV